MWNVAFFLIVVFFGAAVRLGTYVVYEGTQAVVTQFGAIMQEPSTEPGLYFRIPLVQQVHILEKRIETWRGLVDYIPTKDRQYVAVESVAHWRIKHPIVFINKLGSAELAESRLDSILAGAVKRMVSTHSLVDTVRNTNRIVNERRKDSESVESGSANLKSLEDQLNNSITSSLEVVTVGREHLTRKMFAESSGELEKFGIELLGIYITRVSYEPNVERKVYSRMISERLRVAERLLSIGRSERERILGQLSKDTADLLAPAVRDAEILMGSADAEALAIYAKAFGQDPEFYSFWRSIQAYRKSMGSSASIITSTTSNYYKTLFEDPNANRRVPAVLVEPVDDPSVNDIQELVPEVTTPLSTLSGTEQRTQEPPVNVKAIDPLAVLNLIGKNEK